jgi:VWFA-related protein
VLIRLWAPLLVGLLVSAPAGGALAQTPPEAPSGNPSDNPSDPGAAPEPPSGRWHDWLEEIEPLISEAEREAFLGLAKDYQRQAFVEAFWRARDPYPETARNELRERWDANLAEARQQLGSTIDDRMRMFAVFGAPHEVLPGRCPGLLEPLELWSFETGPRAGDFWLVFRQRREAGERVYRLWAPSEGLAHLTVAGGLVGRGPRELLLAISEGCFRGPDVAAALAAAVDWPRLRDAGLFPDPGSEWLHSFMASSTDLPEGSGSFPARLAVSYPGRYQSRTVLQALVAVPRAEVEPAPETRYPSYDFVVDGEVLRKGELFESFRYRFHFPADQLGGEEIPVLVQRPLRPGVYQLVVRLQDVGSGRYYRDQVEVEVPARPDPRPAAAAETTTAGDEPADGPADGGAPATASASDPAAEANAAISSGDWSIRLLPPPEGLQVGNTRLVAVASGEGIARVRFLLDGKPVLSKARPPFSVELALGEQPRTHRVAAVAVDEAGAELARDEMLVNAGPHRFSIRLVEPQRGGSYHDSLRAHAEVTVPEGDRLDRVEVFLNETLVATLYQPPFAQPILLPPKDEIAYVRAVAYLADGNSAEDLVFVNAPEHLEEIDVDMVELYTSVVDRRGRPIGGLEADAFTVREDGVEQAIRRFELVRDLPIYAGVLLDTSSSMAEEIREAVAGALRFFETVITPKDRAAVLTFNHRPELVVRFTNDPEVLAGGVAAITAEGGTALYDSLIYALYYFSGINGKRAVLLLSDGADEGSRYSFDEALDYARRTGVAIYAIGIGLGGSRAVQTRMLLQRLADETGGRSFFVNGAGDLGRVYQDIEGELRTQYLIAYQSSAAGGDGTGFREVEVAVGVPGAEAKTIRGYFP